MMTTATPARALPKTTVFAVPNSSIAAESLAVVEGQRSASTEKVAVKPLMVGNDMLLLAYSGDVGTRFRFDVGTPERTCGRSSI